MATAKKEGTTAVTYVGNHAEVEVRALPGVRIVYGESVDVPSELASSLVEQDDWSKAGTAKVDSKRKAAARATAEAESGPLDETDKGETS